MGQIADTRRLYKEKINSITKTEENWCSFLDSCSWHFKYNFVDKILIYAQRPDATACAEMEKEWNRKCHRWVNKDAKGIFVLSKDENSPYPFRLVFDVSDTHNSRGTEYKLWNVKPEYEEKVIETLETTFGWQTESNELAENIISSAYSMVTDNIQDYLSSIHKNKGGTILENLSDDEIKNITILTVWASVAYMIMTRCGINAREKINGREFTFIKEFNNDKIITTLGTAISDIAEMGLREIAKTVINLQNEEKNINHTFVKDNKQEYSNNKEIDEGGIENGENRIQESWRISNTKSRNGERKNTKWQIRKNEITIPKEKQESRLFDIIDGQKLEQRIDTDPGERNEDGQGNNRKISNTRWDNRRIESTRPVEVGRTNAELQVDSGRTSNKGTNLHLEENNRNVWNDKNDKPKFDDYETIDQILSNAPNILKNQGTLETYLKFNTDAERQKYIANILGNAYTEYIINETQRVGYKSYDNGLYLWKGDYLNRTEECFRNWNEITEYFVAKNLNKENENIVNELQTENEQIQNITEVENTSVFSFSQEENNTLGNDTKILDEKQEINEDYKLAERLNDYMMNYDIIAYHNNFSLDNTREQNIELLQADINDEMNIQDYINFLKTSYDDLDYDDETSVEARALIVELEKRLPYYEFHNGDIVYIGADEFEIRAIDNDRTVLVDTSFPLYTKEMPREEFDKKVKENPANDKLRIGIRIQDKIENTKVDKIIDEQEDTSFNQWLDTFIREKEIDLDYTFTIEDEGITHIFELGNVIENIKTTSKEEQNAIKDMIVKIDFYNGDVVDYFKHLAKALVKNYYQIEEQEIIPEKQENKTELEDLKPQVKRKRRNKIEYFDLHPEIPIAERNNFKIDNNDLGIGGKKEKYKNNIEAIKVLKLCEEQNRYATKEEQEILSKYVGWGGIPEAFDSRIDNWHNEYEELKSLLTEKEYKEAKKSTLTAFYTPPIVIRSIYRALENMGLERGNILEPSCRCW